MTGTAVVIHLETGQGQDPMDMDDLGWEEDVL